MLHIALGFHNSYFILFFETTLKKKKLNSNDIKIFTEADVNTATPSLSNAAATWAGWAVTAVTAKFYRSQSDTPKSSNAHSTSRILLNKPASLG